MVNKDNIEKHFDKLSKEYDVKKPRYYYTQLCKFYASIISLQKKVLDIGCGTGEMLNYLKPSVGVGVDISEEMIKSATKKFLQYKFFTKKIEDFDTNEKFDYITIVGVIEHLTDVEKMLLHIKKFTTKETLIIASWYNPLWEPIVRTMDYLGLKMAEGFHKLISIKRFCCLLSKTGYKVENIKYKFLLPVYFFGITDIINSVAEKCFPKILFIQIVIFKT